MNTNATTPAPVLVATCARCGHYVYAGDLGSGGRQGYSCPTCKSTLLRPFTPGGIDAVIHD